MKLLVVMLVNMAGGFGMITFASTMTGTDVTGIKGHCLNPSAGNMRLLVLMQNVLSKFILHSFGYNTLGTVLLRTAIRHGSVDALSEGIKNLNASKSFHDWGEREHPYTTFFTSLIRYAQEWGFAEVPQQARNAWAEWFNEAQSSPVFSTVKGHGQLNNWQRQWLGLASS